MYPDEHYRAFLLGTADAETEATVEEGLLDGSIGPGHLRQVEEELIDDHLFGRLSSEEQNAFRSTFLKTPDRLQRLNFARALKRYAGRHAATRPSAYLRLRAWIAMPWMLPLAGAMGCALLAVLWLGQRNSNLNYQLAEASNASNERQRLIDTMLEEQRRRATQAAAARSAEEQAAVQPVVRLSPGLTRGLAVIPVLYIGPHASTVTIQLELPFSSTETLREELQDSGGQTIWKQEFSVAKDVSDHGTTFIVLPAGLLTTGDYQLHAASQSVGDRPGDDVMYQLRVRKD